MRVNTKSSIGTWPDRFNVPNVLADKCHACEHFEQIKGMTPRQWLKIERLCAGCE